MSNKFINYLNSMNNSGSNTVAALAEAQVLSPYYSKIKIPRRLGTHIAEMIRKENCAVILTGHAGDGKTSILVQILDELEMLESNRPLREEMTFTKNEVSLYAVKDMSELEGSKQAAYFRKALSAPERGQSSVLISNTGPLLKCFESVIEEDMKAEGKEFSSSERSSLQNIILNQLDENKNQCIPIGKYKVYMINIARIDNVGFAEKVLLKIIDDELWEPCETCSKRDNCPMFFNKMVIKKYKDRIGDFISSYYRYLYESDKRMTIRQMLSQISYMMTGGLTCDKITSATKEAARWNYLFSNLFFGNIGYELNEDPMQIQGIAYANEMSLDTVALDTDYEMFVTKDLSDFPSELRSLLEKQQVKFNRSHMYSDDASSIDREKDRQFRRAFRRAYMMANLEVKTSRNDIYEKLYGRGFAIYKDIIGDHSKTKNCNLIRKIVLDALYIEATGTSTANAETIPLTVKRNDNVYQKVMLITGKIKKDDIKIIASPVDNGFEDNQGKCEIFLVVKEKRFRLTMPMIIYFCQIADGSIYTAANPALTHGISKLKTMLRELCSTSSDDDMFNVFLNRTDMPLYIEMSIEDGKLYLS